MTVTPHLPYPLLSLVQNKQHEMKPLGSAGWSSRPFCLIWRRAHQMHLLMSRVNGDIQVTAAKVYWTLTTAGVHYEMLWVWTTTGRLEDPYEESLSIKESKHISNDILEVDCTDKYWEGQYMVNFQVVSEKMGYMCTDVWVASRWLDPFFEAPACRCSSVTYC